VGAVSLARCTFLALAALATTADAAPWKPKDDRAVALLREGVAAADAGDFARAALLSLKSLEIAPSLIARWNAGQAFASVGDWFHAREQYDQLLTDKSLPRDRRAAIEARRQLAADFLAAEAAAEAQRWDDARAGYLAILSRTDIDQRDRMNASTAIAALAQQRADASAEKVATSTTKPEIAEPTPGPRASATEEAPRPLAAPTIDASPRSRWSDTSAVVLASTGLVVVGVGAGFFWHSGDLRDQADAERDQVRARDLADRADTVRTGGAIALAAGGAVLIAGLVKLAIPPSAPRPTLQATTGGAIVVVGGRF